METNLKHDAVNSPKHYASGRIEVIEAIEDWGLGFHEGNVVKYVARAGKKDPSKHIEDLEKAQWYLKRRIEILRAAAEGRAAIRPNDMNPRLTKEQEEQLLKDIKDIEPMRPAMPMKY